MTHRPSDAAWPSIAFWSCLFTAAVAYGAVALSPKLLDYVALRRVYVAGQVELVELERRNQYLDRVVGALESDPAFAEELARADLDAARPGEERIPVDPEHALVVYEAPQVPESPAAPWYRPLVRRLAVSSRLRTLLLAAAALVTLFAFAFLHEGNAATTRGAFRSVGRAASRLVSRYRRGSTR